MGHGYIFVTADILLSLLLTSLLLLDLALCMWLGLPKKKKNTIPPPFKHHKQNWTVEDWKNVAWSDESRFLLRLSDGRVRIWRKQNENMEPSCLVTTVQAGGGGVMVWRMFSWHTLGPLGPMPQPTWALYHVHPFMATMYPSSDGYFQQDNPPCHKAWIFSNWFLEHDS